MTVRCPNCDACYHGWSPRTACTCGWVEGRAEHVLRDKEVAEQCSDGPARVLAPLALLAEEPIRAAS